VFTIPKMLRPLFFRRRKLRSLLARLAWRTVRELMAATVEQPGLQPGMVSVLQTFGDRINPTPTSTPSFPRSPATPAPAPAEAASSTQAPSALRVALMPAELWPGGVATCASEPPIMPS
jgi:hypothetical protein